jgi:site-specific recombinase XerD
MTVTATLKGVPDSLGRRTVYIRIADGHKRKFYATAIKIEPKCWDKKVINHPKAKVLNEQIKDLILSYEDQGPGRPKSFHAYALTCLSGWERNKKPGTIRQLQVAIDKFKKTYSGPVDLTKNDLTDFVNYCYSISNQENTVYSSLKGIRTIINKALRDKIIREDPFRSFEMPRYRDPAKVYLSKDQVELINTNILNGTIPEDYKTISNWFLISCYTGLRYGDQVAFSRSKIKNGRLVVYTSKTGKIVSFPMNEKLKELFTRVDYKPVAFTNEHYNRSLKVIAAICGIKERISVHTGRHTFGTLCASAGISQEVTASLMGHSSLKTTAIYYQITGERTDREFEKLF